MAGTEMDKRSWQRLLVALKLTRQRLSEKKLTHWLDQLDDAIYQGQLRMDMEGLEEIRPIMKAMIGYDPLERDTRLKGEKPPGLTRSETRETPLLQDLKRRIYVKAKTEPSWRFWGLYVHVCKMETLHAAYRLAKANNGAPGLDGVTFEAIEEKGVEHFLETLRSELVSRTYRPGRLRKVEIPKDGDSKKRRVLSIPSIRDRVVQGALKAILEPIFEADFQPGSFGYRPKKTAHEAVQRVSEAIILGKTYVIDLDLRAYFDTVRHHVVLKKVAQRVKDDDVMHLLRLMMKASGKRGVPQGGVISPLLSNLYLNEVDTMLERAKEVTRTGKWTAIEYARYADDLVILVDPHPRHRWLRRVVEKRLREELAKLFVEVNEDKTRVVDLAKRESFGFLGFTFRRIRTLRGKWMALRMPQGKKRTALLRKLKVHFRRFQSQPTKRLIATINPILRGWVNYFRVGHSSRCFSFVRQWVERKVRRHLARACKRGGFGWKRWSNRWFYEELGLYCDYRIRRYTSAMKAAPA
jgi:RNA-directed DNA polymerase